MIVVIGASTHPCEIERVANVVLPRRRHCNGGLLDKGREIIYCPEGIASVYRIAKFERDARFEAR